jgi:histidinol-phosphate aminotransferase
LCSPNNPTGGVDSPELVREVLALNAGPNPGLVVVDEAYGQFADWSALELVSEETPLVVTRTFSKTWSMAAARLGYLIGPKWNIGRAISRRHGRTRAHDCCRTRTSRCHIEDSRY